MENRGEPKRISKFRRQKVSILKINPNATSEKWMDNVVNADSDDQGEDEEIDGDGGDEERMHGQPPHKRLKIVSSEESSGYTVNEDDAESEDSVTSYRP